METKITSFTGNYDFLANTFPNPIKYNGIIYICADSAFWAQRVKDENARKKFKRLSANEARKKALQAEPVENWDAIKISIMEDILIEKFKDPVLKKHLLATNKLSLINGNTYRDNYWGIYNGSGKNRLGKLLEKVRDYYNQTI